MIGYGALAESVHAPLLSRLPDARLVAIAETDPSRRAAAAAGYPAAAMYSDFEAMLADPSVRAVVVSLPNSLHARAACAALAAGRHLYLEKPVALSTGEGREIIDAWRSAGVVDMMGFNYRVNPLYLRLRAAIAARRAGDIASVRTVFSTASPELPAWKRARRTGGGALLDLGSHHIDLLRWLFGREITRVRATIGSSRAEGDDALLEMELDGGVSVQSFFSLSAVEDDRIEVYGRAAKLVVDRHRSVDVEVSAARMSGGHRALGWTRSLGRRRYVLEKLRSPWHEPSFAASLAHFVAACRGTATATPDLADGYRALCVIEAAESSAREGGFVLVAGSMDVPAAASAHSAAPAGTRDVDGGADGGPALSIILITPDRFDTIRTTVRHLSAQSIVTRLELLIIARSRAALALDEASVSGFLCVRVLEEPDIEKTGAARALGVREARAPVVVFAEDHCFPDPGWATALLAAYAGGHVAVGPVIRNANPDTMVSWADLIIGYGPWLAPGRAECPDQIPGHNSSYDRAALLEYGDRLVEMMDAETVLQWDLRSRGRTLYLEPAATAAHTNFSRWSIWLPALFHHGRVFAAVRAAEWPLAKRIAFALASPLIPLVRFARGVTQARRAGLDSSLIARVIPTMLFGLSVDGLGQMVGYAAGAGTSRERLGLFEFHRVDRNRGS